MSEKKTLIISRGGKVITRMGQVPSERVTDIVADAIKIFGDSIEWEWTDNE